MDKFPRLITAYLRYHHGQESIGCYIERYAEEDIRTALVKLAGKPAFSYIELEHGVAWWQSHTVHFEASQDTYGSIFAKNRSGRHGGSLKNM